ncbi:MAG: cupredoxin domain-containing protein [Blastocatellia bacterium]|nr:cupredoxin domain-containing protein [Blastocatellia bacterium]
MNRTIILLMALTTALGIVTLAAALRTGSAAEKVFRITAKKFEFAPIEITVRKGEPVVLELTSEDRTHGFNLPEFGVRTEVKPGAVSRVHFTPDKTGKFSFACDVFCGSGHEDMSGTLVVTE